MLGGASANPEFDAGVSMDSDPPEVTPGMEGQREGPLPSTEHTDVVRLADGTTVIPGHVLVGLRSGVSVPDSAALRQRIGSLHAGRAPTLLRSLSTGLEVHSVPLDVSLDEALREYRADPRVAFAEPDVVRPLQDVPNDLLVAYQWNLPPVRATAGWSTTHGQTNVRLAIVDTGIFDDGSRFLAPDGKPGHPDLRGKVDLRNDLTTSDTSQKDPDDWVGHGTHVAGIAAAAANNALGIAGLGYNTHLLDAKACHPEGCADSWVIDAIGWSVQNGAKVISLTSASASACPSDLQSAIDWAWSQNVVVVAPAGNSNSTQAMTPADCNHVVSVASTNADDTRSAFSTYGTWVTVAAPGGQDAAGNLILSTGYTGLYEYREGTSMAAPAVSGLAALVWSTPYGTSNNAVVQRIMSSADAISGTGSAWQAGRVNVAAAVGSSQSTAVPMARPITTQVPIPSGWGRSPGLQWGSRSPIPTPRTRVGVGVVGNTIYVVGGANAQDHAVNTVEAYDGPSDTWQARAALPAANAAPGVASAPNGKLYVAGGTPDGSVALNTLRVYDPSSNAWSQAAAMPTPRWGLVLVRGADGKLYAIGGRNATSVLSTVEVYDPASNAWASRTSMPTPRVFAAATLGPTNQRIYVAGGANAAGQPLSAFEVYDPAANSWVVRPNLPTARSSFGLTAVPNGHIYAAGGDNPGTLGSVDEYNGFIQTWSSAVGMPRSRGGGFGLVTLPNGVLYAVGGWSQGDGTPLLAPMDAATLITPKS